MPMTEYSASPSRLKKVRYGLYSNSFHWSVPGFGRKNWVVIVNIDVDHKKHIEEGKTIEEIVAGCVEHLNTPPKAGNLGSNFLRYFLTVIWCGRRDNQHKKTPVIKPTKLAFKVQIIQGYTEV